MEEDLALSTNKKNRTVSTSEADAVRRKMEKLFRLRIDRPLHRCRDPMSLSRLVWNCTGFINWTILLIVIGAIKMFLENLNKFGVRIDPYLWVSTVLGDMNQRNEYPVLSLLVFLNIPLLIAFKTERVLSEGDLSWNTALSIHTANLCSLLLLPVFFINCKSASFGMIGALLTCTLYTVMFMKLISYIQVNKWCRDARIVRNNNVCSHPKFSKTRTPILSRSCSNTEVRRRFYSQTPDSANCPEEMFKLSPKKRCFNAVDEAEEMTLRKRNPLKESASKDTSEVVKKPALECSLSEDTVFNNSEECMEGIVEESAKRLDSPPQQPFYVPNRVDVVYPENLNIRDLYYFWFAPTLCYETNFPRTRRIRTTFLLHRAAEVFIGSNICLCVIQQYIIPAVTHTLVPFSNMELSLATERLLKLALPNHLMWLISFYLLFHSFLNSTAELLQFADRSFFRDWWNATNIETFWKTWNLPVHRWCVRHVYKPLLSYGFSKASSMLVVFFLSAFFHEYLVSVPLRMFKVWVGLGMMAQVPLVFISRLVEAKLGPRFGNMMVWLSLIIGQPLIIMIYYHDYVVEHYGPHLIGVFGNA